MAGLVPAILFVPPHQGAFGDGGDPRAAAAQEPAPAPFACALRQSRTSSQQDKRARKAHQEANNGTSRDRT